MRNSAILFCLFCLACLGACGKDNPLIVPYAGNAGLGAHTVSGTITYGGSALSGVTVTLSGSATASAATDASGYYIFSVANGSYTITPGRISYTFTPASASVTVSNANSTGNNFTAATTQLPKTGQTTSYAARDDGALQNGVAWPAPRFTDNGNGTVTDNLTGLIWLKNANCTDTVGGISKTSERLTWDNALTWSNTLASGACGLTDSSTAGQWRLPNVTELESLVDLEHRSPALPSGHPFTSVQSNYYWSSSSYAGHAGNAWIVYMINGSVYYLTKANNYYVWPVRAGQ